MVGLLNHVFLLPQVDHPLTPNGVLTAGIRIIYGKPAGQIRRKIMDKQLEHQVILVDTLEVIPAVAIENDQEAAPRKSVMRNVDYCSFILTVYPVTYWKGSLLTIISQI